MEYENFEKRLNEELSKPRRRKREINLSRINRFTNADEVILVPGKVLGGGDLNHKITISAFKFSESAITKLNETGSTIVPINDIKTLKGKKIKIIG